MPLPGPGPGGQNWWVGLENPDGTNSNVTEAATRAAAAAADNLPAAKIRGPFGSRQAALAFLRELQHGGHPPAPGPGPGPGPGQPAGGTIGSRIVAIAKTYIGDPSVFGGLDCSRLVQLAYQRMGIKGVPRTSEEQWKWVTKIQQSQLRPGDLIFEQWPGDQAPPGHVVIYAGGGNVIEAPATGMPVHERPWSPTETTIIGYGRPPGINVGGTAYGPGGLNINIPSPSLGGLLNLPSDVLGAFDQLGQLAQAAAWFFQPSNWVRIIAGVFGVFLLLAGVGMLAKAA